MLARAIDQLVRREGPRVLAGLIRWSGDFDLAEDAFQDACARRWRLARARPPRRPGAWLTTVARRRAVDLMRRRRPDVPLEPALLDALGDGQARTPSRSPRSRTTGCGCCSPCATRRLPPTAQIALALRTLCGLTTAEIARAYLEPEATTAQRLVRAKRKIAEARIPFEVPPAERLAERLDGVLARRLPRLQRGFCATEGEAWIRRRPVRRGHSPRAPAGGAPPRRGRGGRACSR